MKNSSSQFGYSLVEVLISIAILLIAIVGPMTIASQGIKSSTFSLEQNSAFFLAQEGIEAVFSIRGNYALTDIDDGLEPSDSDTSWDWISDVLSGGPCSTNFSSDGNTCEFGIDFLDATMNNNLTSNECDSGNEERCRLYFDNGSSARVVYSHNTSGDASEFIRIIRVTRESAYSILVQSTVSWDSHAFGGNTQSVTLSTYMFDSNYEI